MADCALDIISRLATSFNNATKDRDKPDYLTRDIGGQFRDNQPFISGYFQIMVCLPDKLFGSATDAATASKWLHSTVENFQPHSEAITKVDLTGQGQLGASFIANMTTTREFTLGFREYQNFPILNLFRRWNAFDGFTGVTALAGNEFIPRNYKGQITVLQTKPTGSQDRDLTNDDIEEIYIYNGVFPTTVPVDTAAAADVTANDMIQLSVTFSFDGYPIRSSEPGARAKALSTLNGLRYIGGSGEYKSTYCKAMENLVDLNQWGTWSPPNLGSFNGVE